MIVKLKRLVSQPDGIKKPRHTVLGGTNPKSVDGKRLDQNTERNFGAELAKLSREKNQLSQGLQSLTGGDTMAKIYKLKRKGFSITTKTYTLKRKTFAFGDVLAGGVQGVGTVTNNVLGGTEKVVGNVANKAGNIVNSKGGRLAGTVLGAIKGAKFGGLGGALVGGFLGNMATRAAGTAVSSVGESLEDSAAKRGFA